jgi:RNA polymerase-interacting CarD/CdnL/TRCF family regulator
MTELSKLTSGDVNQMTAIIRTLYREGVLKPSEDYKTVSYIPNRGLEKMFDELTSGGA